MKMITFKNFFLPIFTCLILIASIDNCGKINNYDLWHEKLKIDYAGDAKIEVGGPFVGVEFHHSICIPQRISFYYPVANSIDVSSDYWRRDTTFVMAIGLKFGENAKEWLGDESYDISLTPYRVEFQKQDSGKKIDIIYQFAKTKPTMVVTYIITNLTSSTQNIEFETHLETSLRTSHSFTMKNSAWTQYDDISKSVYTYHTDEETQRAVIFVGNAADQPISCQTRGPLNLLRSADFSWPENPLLVAENNPSQTATRYLYQKKVNGGENLKIVQIIGTATAADCHDIMAYMLRNYQNEVDLYEHDVLEKAFSQLSMSDIDPDLYHSVHWARAIMTANEHYLDGQFIAMPCPAEYNFYFTHDVLVSDLAAANDNLERVKRDLDYIVQHSNKANIIPHAYYWKNDKFVTEFADSDNWNNFWMIITSASYLRHSADTSFTKTLYPYLDKCLQIALKTKLEDNLMWTYRPDWWDIGKNYAPRSYMTILAIKAIREYIYTSTILGQNINKLLTLENLSDSMQMSLVKNLWFDDSQYLMNYYEDGSVDRHYYIGSLLAAHYDLLDPSRQTQMISRARDVMLDEKVGIYNAYPMDYQNLIDYLKFSGNEAGAPYYYFNGGIWPQGNAWYALALISEGNQKEAWDFLLKTMTVKGVMRGPNGQPAMYEVRNANRNSPNEYGSVDKPQFMWAGAWYLYALYRLLGMQEDHWNLSFLTNGSDLNVTCTYGVYLHGRKVEVSVSGQGEVIEQLEYSGMTYYSAVVPEEFPAVETISVKMGTVPAHPYLKSTNAALLSVTYDPSVKKLNLKLKAFTNHQNQTTIITPLKIKTIHSDSSSSVLDWVETKQKKYSEVTISSKHRKRILNLWIEFF
jgi:hypothetical protein